MSIIDYKKIIERVQKWLHNYLKSSGSKGFVVGLSGGLDSSVTAVLCREVTKNTIGLLLPCNSNSQDIEDAMLVAKRFDIETKLHDLTPVCSVLLNVLGTPETYETTQKAAIGNIKSRLRMIALYYAANSLSYIVVGSSNKTELILGYFTKYGDGGSDILPLGNFLKRDVRRIGEILGIPRKIISKTPSAGLWPGQTDEGELGASYDVLDRIVANEDVADVDVRLTNRLRKLIETRKHKRSFPPICMI